MNQLDFKGRSAVVTGGLQGIGAAIAKRLESSGAKVMVWDLAAKKDAIDVSDAGAVERATAKALADLGKIDVLVNNAGVVLSQPQSSTTPSSGLARIDSSTSMLARLR